MNASDAPVPKPSAQELLISQLTEYDRKPARLWHDGVGRHASTEQGDFPGWLPRPTAPCELKMHYAGGRGAHTC